MRGLLVMGIPYQHAPEVSIVRTDTCTCMPVHVIQVNLLPPVATAHHVIHSPRILDAQLARHPDIQDYAQTTVNSQNDPSYGLTPFRAASTVHTR